MARFTGVLILGILILYLILWPPTMQTGLVSIFMLIVPLLLWYILQRPEAPDQDGSGTSSELRPCGSRLLLSRRRRITGPAASRIKTSATLVITRRSAANSRASPLLPSRSTLRFTSLYNLLPEPRSIPDSIIGSTSQAILPSTSQPSDSDNLPSSSSITSGSEQYSGPLIILGQLFQEIPTRGGDRPWKLMMGEAIFLRDIAIENALHLVDIQYQRELIKQVAHMWNEMVDKLEMALGFGLNPVVTLLYKFQVALDGILVEYVFKDVPLK